jgi:hypothetical protein
MWLTNAAYPGILFFISAQGGVFLWPVPKIVQTHPIFPLEETRMAELKLQAFVTKHAPDSSVKPPSAALVQSYRGILPDALLELWERVGLGRYGAGAIQLINPDEYKPALYGWLMLATPNPDRIPIAISAFGKLFYYRKLAERAEDVAFIDPHWRSTDVVNWSLEDFFNDSMCDDDIIEDVLQSELFGECTAKYGGLAEGEIYFYVPALVLGGSESVDSMGQGNALVHLELLLQMT